MLVIRLSRRGKKKQPIYRLIISEKTKDPQADYLEALGFYNPHSKEINLKEERIKYWIDKGASTSDSVNNLLIKEGIIKGKKRVKGTHKKKEKKGSSEDKEEKTEEKDKANDKEKSAKGGSPSGEKENDSKEDKTDKEKSKEKTEKESENKSKADKKTTSDKKESAKNEPASKETKENK